MFFCWGIKPDRDELPYGWYFHGKPVHKSHRHGDKVRHVCPVVGVAGPAPDDSDHHAPLEEPRDVRRSPDMPRHRRRRDHDVEQHQEQPHVARAARTDTASDSPPREPYDYYHSHQSSHYYSRSQSCYLSRRASPDYRDDLSVSSSGSSQEDPVPAPRQHLQQPENPSPARHQEDREAARPSPGHHAPKKRSPKAHHRVRFAQPVEPEAPAPRPEHRAEHAFLPIRCQRARSPVGHRRRRRDAGAPLREGILRTRHHEQEDTDDDALSMIAQVGSRPHAKSVRREPGLPRPERHARPHPVVVHQDDAARRDHRQQSPLNEAPVGSCGCEECVSDAYD